MENVLGPNNDDPNLNGKKIHREAWATLWGKKSILPPYFIFENLKHVFYYHLELQVILNIIITRPIIPSYRMFRKAKL